MKNKNKIKESIISHFDKKRNGNPVNIIPEVKNPIPKILEPIKKEKNENPKKEQNYVPTEFNEAISKLNKRLDFIAKRPNEYLNTNTIEKHYKDTNNNKTIEKHYKDTNNNKTIEKHYKDTKNKERIINIPKEIKIPTVINPPSVEEKGSSAKKEIKNIKTIQNNIKKMLFQNSKNEIKNNIRNNNKSENPLSFTVNKTNISNKALSKVLERNTDTNTKKVDNKYFNIDKSTVNKILSGKVQVPKTIPAYKYGGEVPKTFGGKLVVAGDGGEDEVISTKSQMETMIKAGKQDGKPLQIIKNENRNISSVANESIIENTTLRQQEASEPTAEFAASGDKNTYITNNYSTSNSDGGQGGGGGGFGGGTKATESMGLQTQYPIWRRGFG